MQVNNRLIKWFIIISLTILYVILRENNYLLYSNIVSILLTILVVIYTIEDNIYMLFYFFPLYLYIYIGNFAFYNIIVISLLLKMLLTGNKITFKAFIMTSLILLFELFQHLYNANYEFLYMFKWILSLFVSIWILEKRPKNYIHLYSVLLMNIGMAIIGLGTIFQYGNLIVDSSLREILRGGLSTLDQNTFSFYGLFVFVSGISIILEYKKYTNKYDALYLLSVLLLSIINLISSFLMISKTFIFVFIFILSLVLLYYLSNIRRFIKYTLIIVIIALILLSFDRVNNIMLSLVNRITAATNINEFTTGRFELFLLYINKLSTNVLTTFIGAGLFTYQEYYSMPLITHNILLELICAYGLIGTILIISQYLIILLKNFCKNISLISLLPMITFVLFTQSLAIYREDVTHFIIVFCVYHMSRMNTKTERLEIE